MSMPHTLKKEQNLVLVHEETWTIAQRRSKVNIPAAEKAHKEVDNQNIRYVLRRACVGWRVAGFAITAKGTMTRAAFVLLAKQALATSLYIAHESTTPVLHACPITKPRTPWQGLARCLSR